MKPTDLHGENISIYRETGNEKLAGRIGISLKKRSYHTPIFMFYQIKLIDVQ